MGHYSNPIAAAVGTFAAVYVALNIGTTPYFFKPTVEEVKFPGFSQFLYYQLENTDAAHL